MTFRLRRRHRHRILLSNRAPESTSPANRILLSPYVYVIQWAAILAVLGLEIAYLAGYAAQTSSSSSSSSSSSPVWGGARGAPASAQTGGRVDEKPTPQVIAFVFAGRTSRLEILHKYMAVLLEENLVTEYHIWNNTKTNEDAAFVKREAARLPRTKMMNFIQTSSSGWSAPYQYYEEQVRAAHNNTLKPNDILVKIDDDISFIDLQEFRGYIDYVSQSDAWTIAPNIINNAIFAYYQRRDFNLTTLSPTCLKFLPKSLENRRHIGPRCGKQRGPLEYYMETQMPLAYQLCLLNTSLTDIKRPQSFRSPAAFEIEPVRYSINFFATKAKTYELLAPMVRGQNGYDELAITSYAHCLGRRSMFYPDLTVAHISFEPQDEVLGHRLAPLYKAYAENYIKAYREEQRSSLPLS
ncbi:hypothetical protein ACHAWF_003242 [Thalassiosira exigua]